MPTALSSHARSARFRPSTGPRLSTPPSTPSARARRPAVPQPGAVGPARSVADLARAVVETTPSAPPVPSGLRYVDDAAPGITRRRLRDRWAYFDAKGRRVTDPGEIARIDRLAIPPAYVDVWICPYPDGHLQATGRDARGRKQYRYHVRWRETRDATKFSRMLDFGHALPRVRARVERDLALPGMPREKVLAAIVRLLDSTLIRVGNVEYARDNDSYGLTTLRGDHVAVRGDTIRFRFRGKSGVQHDVRFQDPRVARIVRRCMDLPGQELFTYLDEEGQARAVGSADVNAYLQEAAGGEFTAKDYRTWAGTALALYRLQRLPPGSGTEAKRNVVATVTEAAHRLGNTPAVCRKCYVHPGVIEDYLAGGLPPPMPARARKGLRAGEAALLAYLRSRADKRACV